jgi:hypothetical protein
LGGHAKNGNLAFLTKTGIKTTFYYSFEGKNRPKHPKIGIFPKFMGFFRYFDPPSTAGLLINREEF